MTYIDKSQCYWLKERASAMPHRTVSKPSAHRRHSAYDPHLAHTGAPSSARAAQLIIAALSFTVIVGAAFHALGFSLGS
jgi:hypothetical protein